MLEFIDSLGTEVCLACNAAPTVATPGAINRQFCLTCLAAVPEAVAPVKGRLPGVTSAWTLGPRSGALGGMVAASRSGGDEAVLWALARHTAWSPKLPDADAVAAVPANPWRRLVRGLNPSDVVACAVASTMGVPLYQPLVVRRASTGRGGEALLPAAEVPARMLLVADTLPGAATLTACAAVLRDAGADEVHVLALVAPPDLATEPAARALPMRPLFPARLAGGRARRGVEQPRARSVVAG